ncbi:L,D-transpeptidase [Methylobacterium trifolii]|uniref:L,D-TPase catalytic domain-containing protein n=1 Tax=Methylobacterium trifolii TaxID=1003092 RepID=A0ABQ4U0M0_9HYPH|nr:L,D-transpeptidase [Methylobacterium trifolii]GJE60821.1 hypothetical protein MPOCJGCO_2939 [Methylobacterium trifolii]
MGVRVCVAGLLAVATWGGAAQAQGRYAEPGSYGGGLIEYLVNGSAGAPPAARGSYAPRREAYGYGAPRAPMQSGDPIAGYGTAGPDRYASLPQASEPPETGRIARSLDPQYARQEVEFSGSQRPGTIVIDTPSKYLYLVQPGRRAIRYGIGVGRPGFAWSGLKSVSRKAEWPDWTPPPEMLARRPDLPRHMEGGPANPLGARALYLGSSLYRIHGTNEPHTIGQSVSSGCIRMMNEDVIDLYERTPVGTRVEVM